MRRSPNPRGTAPGVRLRIAAGEVGGPRGCDVYALPGVPGEMKPMFREHVAPGLPGGAGRIRVARVNLFGLGETAVEERLGDLTARGRVPEVGITAHEATITLRIAARGTDAQIERQFADTKRLIRDRVGDLIFGEEDDTLTGSVLRLLRDRGETLSVYECGTGGRLADWLSEEDDPADPRFLFGAAYRDPRASATVRSAHEHARFDALSDDEATYRLLTPPLRERALPQRIELFGPGAANPAAAERYRHGGDSLIARSRLAKAALALLRRHLLTLPPPDRTAP